MPRSFVGAEPEVSRFTVVAHQDGGLSLAPMENTLRVVRSDHGVMSLELYGTGGVVGYQIRSNIGTSLLGRLQANFPQARIDREMRRLGDDDFVAESMKGSGRDWLFLDEPEFALVQPLHLEYDSYLPLRIYDDRVVRESEKDPLAGIIGLLASATERHEGPVFGGGERMGVRVVMRPAKENWGQSWQNWMQQRRDGEDRKNSGRGGDGPSVGLVLAGAGLAGVAGLNWFLWQQDMLPYLIASDAAVLAGGIGGLWYWKRNGGRRKRRPYLDEQLVEDKLKSLAYYTEVQLIRIYRNMADEDLARDDLAELLNSLRFFDDPVGNSWRAGEIEIYEGEDVFQGEREHPFRGGDLELDWLDPKRSRRTVLSVREVACLWHPPLGSEEMASMERTSYSQLVPYMPDLSALSEDSGPLVGYAAGHYEVRLPGSALRKHAIILGKSGQGKSTIIKHILDHLMKLKVSGDERTAVVVIDPHADLVADVLKLVPPELVGRVRLLDFGRRDRVPGINLVDPELFPDRDRCVDTIVTTVRHLWDTWGGRLEDLLRKSLMIVYEFNRHPDTPRNEMMTMLDILHLLEDGVPVMRGRNQVFTRSEYQSHVLSRVESADLHQWFDQFLTWDSSLRSEALSPVYSRIGAFATNLRASVVLGQRESTITFKEVLTQGQVVLVSTASGTIGDGPAALLGGTMVSLVEAALREQESLESSKRAKCLLVCDEFQTVTGANWEGMLAEVRKYGGSLMLATQSLERLDTPERKLKAGILGNVGCFVAYQMSFDDARTVASEMDSERVPERSLVTLDPHNCIIKINSDTKSFRAFSMKTLPPPDMTHGSSESASLVLENSKSYTVDWSESWHRLNEEKLERIRASAAKIGSSTGAAAGAGGGGAKRQDPAMTDVGGGEQPPRPFRGRGGGGAAVETAPASGPESSPAGGNGSSGGNGHEGLSFNPDLPMDLLVEASAGGASGGSIYDELVAADGVKSAEAPKSSGSLAGTVSGAARLGDNYKIVAGKIVGKGALRGLRFSDIEDSRFDAGVLERIVRDGHLDPQVRDLLDKRLAERLERERTNQVRYVQEFLDQRGVALSDEEAAYVRSGGFLGEPRPLAVGAAVKEGTEPLFDERVLGELAASGGSDSGVRAALDKRLGDEVGAQERMVGVMTQKFLKEKGLVLDEESHQRLVGRFYRNSGKQGPGGRRGRKA